jgi:hypothetical protein
MAYSVGRNLPYSTHTIRQGTGNKGTNVVTRYARTTSLFPLPGEHNLPVPCSPPGPVPGGRQVVPNSTITKRTLS